ncbi:MAG: hypothetical protein GYA85_04275 [Propionibacterium sp.]|nr:hypothetical protein [Propionibacterium sp.]
MTGVRRQRHRGFVRAWPGYTGQPGHCGNRSHQSESANWVDVVPTITDPTRRAAMT